MQTCLHTGGNKLLGNLRNALGVSFWGSPLVSQILFLGWDVDVMTVKEFLMQQLFLHE